MKKILNILSILAAGALLCSCEGFISDALDIDPSDRYSAEAVVSSASSADQYLLVLYILIK